MRLFALTFALFIAWSTAVAEQAFPVCVDELTHLESVTPDVTTKNPVVIYQFRVALNVDYLNAVDIKRFRESIQQNVIQLACNDPDVRRILNDRISLRYVYYDKINTLIARVDVSQSTCKQRS